MKVFVYGNSDILKNYSDALSSCNCRHYIGKEINHSIDCSGLLLAGGGDINPSLYGKRREYSYNIDYKRDLDEIELIRLFIVTGRPILGICRGIQIINVALGGVIIQDLDTANTHKYDDETGDKIHGIKATENSFLKEIYGEDFMVNSAHHQGIENPPENLSIAAFAEDGVIEAVEDKKRKIYAVQFHPERMGFTHKRNDTVDGRYIFDYFLEKC